MNNQDIKKQYEKSCGEYKPERHTDRGLSLREAARVTLITLILSGALWWVLEQMIR